MWQNPTLQRELATLIITDRPAGPASTGPDRTAPPRRANP
jgi:hypothetical protein